MHWIIFASQGWRFTLFLYWKWIEKYVDRHIPWIAKMAINILYKILLSCKWHGPCFNKFVWSNICISRLFPEMTAESTNAYRAVIYRICLTTRRYRTHSFQNWVMTRIFYIHLAILRKYTSKFLKVQPRGKAVSVKRLLEIYIHLHVYYVK